MKKILTAFTTIILFASCQKEISFDVGNTGGSGSGGGTGGNANGTRLVKIGSRLGADSITSIYTYTTAGLLNGFSQSGIINGISGTAEIRAVRNSSAIITSTIVKTNALAQFGLDSIINYHTYDPANKRYKYSISSITIFGDTETDSVVYNYDAGGKLIAAIDYSDDGSGYVPYSKEEYAYSAANISTIKTYLFDDAANTYELEQTVNHEYDTKTNPLSFPADAPILGMGVFYPANNPIKTTTIETAGPVTTVKNIAYTYNTSSRPAVAITSGVSGAAASVNTYYYQ